MSVEDETTKPDYWEKLWKDDDIGWHADTVHKFLTKYADELTRGRSNLRVFVPLCGKSLDMLWLADQGHNVVGVELAKQAVEDFFQESKLTFKLEKVKIVAATDPINVRGEENNHFLLRFICSHSGRCRWSIRCDMGSWFFSRNAACSW